jgi:DNA-binding CsgD family transcriptional regulator
VSNVRCCRGEHVTERELDVLVLLSAGATNARTARELHVAPSTVRQHLTSLYRRFGVPSRGALVARAAHVGLLDVSVWPPVATSRRCVSHAAAGGQRWGSYPAA